MILVVAVVADLIIVIVILCLVLLIFRRKYNFCLVAGINNFISKVHTSQGFFFINFILPFLKILFLFLAADDYCTILMGQWMSFQILELISYHSAFVSINIT